MQNFVIHDGSKQKQCLDNINHNKIFQPYYNNDNIIFIISELIILVISYAK
jgi:hypothetical protein